MSVATRTQQRGDQLPELDRTKVRPSHVTLKVTMAVTGTILGLFVFVHMIGNLKALMGPEDYNGYAKLLRTLFYPLLPYEGALWIFRIVLLTCLVLHVWAGLTIWIRGRKGRGSYRRKSMRSLTFGSRTMILSGLLILAFIIVHILDLTIGAGVASSSFSGPQNPGPDVQMSAYENLVASLSRPGMAIFYPIVMLVVCLHLCQGGWNAINDLGGTGPRLRKVWLIVAILIALAIAVCNGALPMLILAGVIS